jgi:aubergine-like protein
LNTPEIWTTEKKSHFFDVKARYKVHKGNDLTDWVCVYHQKNYDDAVTLCDTLQKCSKAIGMKVADPTWIEINSFKYQDWIDEINCESPQKKQIIVCVLDRNMDKLYKELKLDSLSKKGYLTQCVKTQSLRKNAMSACTNLLKQMNSKLGGASYAVEFDKTVQNENFMVVGVDSSHISGKRTGVALVASTDSKFLNFYNKIDIIAEKNKEQLTYCVRTFLEEAIQNYFKKNANKKDKLPSGIVIFRQGVSLEQKEFLKKEIAEIKSFLSGEGIKNILSENPIPFYYVLVNTKTNFKFFEMEKVNNFMNYNNPQQGFIIYDQVTNPDLFEFYLQPQLVTQGTATPSSFTVASGNLDQPEMVVKLTYDLCFSYPNWSGPIRVPGPLKLAEKLSKMTAKYTKTEIHDSLKNSLSFI